jgi:hypothetical protein
MPPFNIAGQRTMELDDLLNPRVSYQVIVTFDLRRADKAVYAKLRREFAAELTLEGSVHLSRDEGGQLRALPFNTMAVLWRKDDSEQATRDYFAHKLKKIFQRRGLRGRFIVLVAQNWAVGAEKF